MFRLGTDQLPHESGFSGVGNSSKHTRKEGMEDMTGCCRGDKLSLQLSVKPNHNRKSGFGNQYIMIPAELHTQDHGQIRLIHPDETMTESMNAHLIGAIPARAPICTSPQRHLMFLFAQEPRF